MEDNLSHDMDLETVFSAIGTEAEMEVLAIKGMLEANAIQAVVVGTAAIPTLPFSIGVPREQAVEALRLIEEAKAAGPAAAEEAEGQPLTIIAGLVKGTIPILPSLSLDESIACYAQLGFSLSGRSGDDYAIVERDGFTIHLFPLDDKSVCENTSCYIMVADAAALREELVRNGIERVSDVEAKPWKMLEFVVIDSSGCQLRFGQPA
jgi:hypothetical protein